MNIDLKDVSETLWLPLFGKAIESKRENNLIFDKKAIEIAEKACELNPSLSKWWTTLSKETQALMVWRNQVIDQKTKDFISKHPYGTIVNLGAGLCTRFDRVDNGKITWLEFDLPPVKSAWLNFNKETKNHQYHTQSIFESDWLETVNSFGSENHLFIAEGLFMYFSKEQVKSIINAIIKEVPNPQFVLELYSKFVLRRPHPDVKNTSAKRFEHPWGIRKGRQLEGWNPKLIHVSDNYLMKHQDALLRMPISHKIGAKTSSLIRHSGKIVHLKTN